MVDIWNSKNNILFHNNPGGGGPYGRYPENQGGWGAILPNLEFQ